MAITAPVPVDALPTAPDPNNRATFDGLAYPWSVALDNPFRTQMNALAVNVYANAQQVVDLAGVATGAAGDAAVQADLAMSYRNQAGGYASAASGYASTSLGYRDQAGVFAGTATTQAELATAARQGSETARDQTLAMGAQVLTASSTTSLAIGTGAKSLTVEPGRAFGRGQRLLLASAANASSVQMQGTVESYDRATGALEMTITSASGTGSRADWLVSVGGGDAGTLPVVVITANTAGVVNRCYVIAAAGITLTLPTTWTAGDRFSVREAIGSGTYVLDFGATPLRSVAVGSTTVPAAYAGADFSYLDSTRGLI